MENSILSSPLSRVIKFQMLSLFIASAMLGNQNNPSDLTPFDLMPYPNVLHWDEEKERVSKQGALAAHSEVDKAKWKSHFVFFGATDDISVMMTIFVQIQDPFEPAETRYLIELMYKIDGQVKNCMLDPEDLKFQESIRAYLMVSNQMLVRTNYSNHYFDISSPQSLFCFQLPYLSGCLLRGAPESTTSGEYLHATFDLLSIAKLPQKSVDLNARFEGRLGRLSETLRRLDKSISVIDPMLPPPDRKLLDEADLNSLLNTLLTE